MANSLNKSINKTLKNLEKYEKYLNQQEIQRKQLQAEYTKKLLEEIEFIMHHAVTQFYDSYSRHVYMPTGNLYNAYKVTDKTKKGNNTNEYNISIELGAEFMKEKYERGATADYIYNLSFVKGFHGGAFSSTAPSSSVPYWREPVPFYTSWYKPAVHTTPPRSIILKELKELKTKGKYEIYNQLKKKIMR